MKTGALKKALQMFGAVPVSFFRGTQFEAQAQDAYRDAQFELKALEESHADMARALHRFTIGAECAFANRPCGPCAVSGTKCGVCEARAALTKAGVL